MKLKNILTGSLAGALLLGSLSACTDLTETVYDHIMSNNYIPPLRTWILQHRAAPGFARVLCRSIGYLGTRWLVV